MNNIKHIEIPVGYQKTSIGLIPKEWEVKEILDVGVIKGGYAFKSREFKDDGKFQVVKMSNIYKGTLDLNRSSSFLTELDEREKEYFLEKGDILISLTGTVGKQDYGYTYLIEEEENLLLNQRLAKISSKGDLIYQYLFYSLKTQQFLKQFFNSSHGGTGNQANVGVVDLGRIDIPIPPLPEQKAIANCLSTWDKGIEKLTALIQSKKEQKKGLMQQIFNGQLKVDNGQLIQGKEGEDFIKNWKKVRINEISKLGRGRVISKKEIENNLGIYPVYSSQTTNNGVFGYLNTYDFEGEYITWTTDGVNAGSIFYRTGRFNCTNVCGTVKLKKGYDYYFVKSALNRVAERYVSRTLANPKLMNGVFGTIEIMIPSYDEQRSITKVLMDFDKEIELLEKKLDQFKTQKKGLMQVLLTGERRLINN